MMGSIVSVMNESLQPREFICCETFRDRTPVRLSTNHRHFMKRSQHRNKPPPAPPITTLCSSAAVEVKTRSDGKAEWKTTAYRRRRSSGMRWAVLPQVTTIFGLSPSGELRQSPSWTSCSSLDSAFFCSARVDTAIVRPQTQVVCCLLAARH